MGRRARDRLAQRMRMLRTIHGWSQEELAQASGLHRTYISLIERSGCNVSLDNLEKLADAFELPLPELLSAADTTRIGERLLVALTRRVKPKEA